MVNYGLIFKGISQGGKVFNLINPSETQKNFLLKVYNTYFGACELTQEFTYEPGVEYWNYVVTNSIERYVELRDTTTYEVVGLFGLEGEISLKECDYDSYAKRAYNVAPGNGKTNILAVYNEIVCSKTYHNEWVDVEEGDVVVDIGFNYGLFSTVSMKKNPKRIIGFEPNPKLVDFFKKNYFGKKIELHNLAVSNTDSTVSFYENGDSAMSTIVENINQNYRVNTLEIDAININTLVKKYNLDVIDYLKVDCEGAEIGIFEEFDIEYLKNNVRKIAIEFHDLLNSHNVQQLINKKERRRQMRRKGRIK